MLLAEREVRNSGARAVGRERQTKKFLERKVRKYFVDDVPAPERS